VDLSLTYTTCGLMGSVDGTSINTNHLACTWKVEMKMRDSIKGGGNEKGDRKIKKETM